MRGEAENRGEPAALAILAPPRDPDLCICRLDLKDDHPGFVIHPRHVVGVQGDVKLRASWRLFNFHAWATQQVRYICFSGEGAVYLTGHGGLFAADASGVRLRLDEKVVVGFDARLAYSARRTETFVPYLLGRTSLVDDSFTGEGLILREAVSGVPSGGTLVERGLQGLITAVGKFFGF